MTPTSTWPLEQVHARRVPLHRPKVHRHFAIDRHRRHRRPLPRARWPNGAARSIVGDPTDDATQMGPVVNDSALKSISAGIDTAAAQGATVLAGGQPYTDAPLAGGYFVAPTDRRTADGSPPTSGPRNCSGPSSRCDGPPTPSEAFALANDSEFGLSAAVFTQDLTRALQAVEHIDVGVLHINSESAGADPHVPFGGAKKSGLGPKEQGGAAREFFTHTTTVYLRGGRPGA